MYNRYIRNETGGYTRVPQEGPPHQRSPGAQPPKEPPQTPPPAQEPPRATTKDHSRSSRSPSDGISSILRHLLDQLRLDRVDTGDLLLLGLLFFLFREKADEELLVALGLLLIL